MAQAHMTMGHEERVNNAKMEKTQLQVSSTDKEYQNAVKALEETTSRWNREWKATCDVSITFEAAFDRWLIFESRNFKI